MIWLIGNRGMLGSEICGVFAKNGLDFVGTDREVDIRDPKALADFAEAQPGLKWIVNCAAYTAVDKAEDEEEAARSLNALGAGNIARAAAGCGAAMLHVSTDYVFFGNGILGKDGKKRPYLESDPAHPASAYGRTKKEGEEAVRAACPRHFILRTAWLYGLHGPNFVYTMLRLMKSKDSIGVVADQFGSPTWARDLAEAIAYIVGGNGEAYGTYHYTDSGLISWHDFALEIMRLGVEHGLFAKEIEVKSLRSDEYPAKAKRPAWSVLSKEKILGLGAKVPDWKESLALFLESCATLKRRQGSWLWHVEYDLGTAEADFASGRYLAVAFWCQQSVEKLLKACLEEFERPLPSHTLLKLASRLRLDLSEEQRLLLKELELYYVASRYEENVEILSGRLDRDTCQSVFRRTKEFVAWLRQKQRFLAE
jgi:dTDP-4-dehydrorhamnose reductase